MIDIFQMTAAFFFGAVAGGMYFYSLWRSTKSFVLNRSSGVAFLISGIFRLAIFLGVAGYLLSAGIGALTIGVGLFGFFLARIAATRWVRWKTTRCDDVSCVGEGAHENQL
ncbi:MAG: ATP synthase subunit I [Alphaproteobacteria bacterium]|nr:ATP synthase subunit I [Alphaproteobacteria bacterium]